MLNSLTSDIELYNPFPFISGKFNIFSQDSFNLFFYFFKLSLSVSFLLNNTHKEINSLCTPSGSCVC